jgi:hypothetical protein
MKWRSKSASFWFAKVPVRYEFPSFTSLISRLMLAMSQVGQKIQLVPLGGGVE